MADQYRLASDFVFRGRIMYPRGSEAEVKPILLPFGSIPRNLDGYWIRVAESSPGQGPEVRVRRKPGCEAVEILPVYRARRTLQALGCSMAVELWVLQSDRERARAYQLILRSHYLNVPAQGFFLGCRFVNPAQQLLLRSQYADSRPDPWSPAWAESPGRMVGVAVGDWLYHGVPKRRRQLAEAFGEKKVLREWDNLTRGELVSRLEVAWGARFVVDAPYRGFGLGSLLAAELGTVLEKHRVPRAKYVEVITTLPTDRAIDLIESGKDDFLTKAGYSRVPETRPSQRQLHMDAATGDRDCLVSARKLYYYRRCTSK